MTARDSGAESRIRRLLAMAAAGSVAGIAGSIAVSPLFGSLVTGIAVLSLVLAVHRFGRLGPDGAPPRRSRRRRGDSAGASRG